MIRISKFVIKIVVLLYIFENGMCRVPILPHSEVYSEMVAAAAAVRPKLISTRNTRSDYDVRTNCSSSTYGNRIETSLRVKALREKMLERSFDAIMIPSSDEYQNEFVAPSDKRREFATGFSGSAGTAVLTIPDQVLWTDTRYSVQADREIDCHWKLITESAYSVSRTQWLISVLPSGARVGADMRLFGAQEWLDTEAELAAAQMTLEDSGDLVDVVWSGFDRPALTNGPLQTHPIQFAGIDWKEKVSNIRWVLQTEKVDVLVVTQLDDIAWLLNLRGSDIPFNPVFRSYVAFEATDAAPIHLFLDDGSLISKEVERHLNIKNCTGSDICVVVHPHHTIRPFLQNITQSDEIKKVSLSKSHPYSKGTSYYIYSSIPKEKRVVADSPIMIRKARKNEWESQVMKEAQIKDAVALVEFFAFLEKEIESGASWDEISVLTPLTNFRKEQDHYMGSSFEAISAFGSNGAIVHYVPSPETKKQITTESLYLLDSGGQYLDGTTDVTRTLHFGTPTPFQIEAYTRVLKGAVDLASLKFNSGTKDIFLDIIARRPLYEAGLDYGHGTGHGVGLYLSVHEGPTLLAMNEKQSSFIEDGQFFSDEPGYYEPNDFGIRLESLLHVKNHLTFKDRWGNSMQEFEVVTLVPFEPKLIDPTLLTVKQCQYLNIYNQQIRDVIGERLYKKNNQAATQWMLSKTEPMKC